MNHSFQNCCVSQSGFFWGGWSGATQWHNAHQLWLSHEADAKGLSWEPRCHVLSQRQVHVTGSSSIRTPATGFKRTIWPWQAWQDKSCSRGWIHSFGFFYLIYFLFFWKSYSRTASEQHISAAWHQWRCTMRMEPVSILTRMKRGGVGGGRSAHEMAKALSHFSMPPVLASGNAGDSNELICFT